MDEGTCTGTLAFLTTTSDPANPMSLASGRASTIAQYSDPWAPIQACPHTSTSLFGRTCMQCQLAVHTYPSKPWFGGLNLPTGHKGVSPDWLVLICHDEKADIPGHLNRAFQQAVTTFISIISECVQCLSFTITTPIPGISTPFGLPGLWLGVFFD